MTDARSAGEAGGYSSVSYRRPSTGTPVSPVSLVVPAPLPRAPSLDPAPHTRDTLLCPCAALRGEIAQVYAVVQAAQRCWLWRSPRVWAIAEPQL